MKESSRREPGLKPPARSNNAKTDTAKTQGQHLDRPDPRAERAERALSSVLFVQLPAETLKSLGISGLGDAATIPIQTQGPLVRFDPSMVNVESIVAGMLRVLAWQPDNLYADSYRQIVRSLRPGLLAELSDAGIAKAQEKEWEIAEEIFLALVGLYPDAPEALLDLALLREEHAKLYHEETEEVKAESEDDLAYECYRKLLAMEPPFAPAYYHAAFFFVRKRSFDRAVSLFTSFIGLSDDEDKVARTKEVLKKLQNLGYLDTTFKEAYDFIQMGEEEKGLEKAMEFVGKYPAVWNGWFLAGWAQRRLSRWKDALEAFSQAVSLGAQETDTFNEMALCQIELRDFAAARASLEKALRIEPENVKIIVNLGALAFRLGKKGEALGFFRSALVIDPNDALAKDWIEKVGEEG
ncbi:MAG: tetratricopeptide repeat protein [Rectinemataceae bacterium]|nr:tetratricopeptide repeat protein [Rectinemataceae bacterium]